MADSPETVWIAVNRRNREYALSLFPLLCAGEKPPIVTDPSVAPPHPP